jgi:hypothetical protein
MWKGFNNPIKTSDKENQKQGTKKTKTKGQETQKLGTKKPNNNGLRNPKSRD